MFRGETPDKWEPFKVRPKDTANGAKQEPVESNGISLTEPDFYEDQETEEGAIWPMKQGRIVDWPAFFGLIEYVYNRLGPTIYTPICLVSQPCWSMKDQQKITQYIFEKFRPPAFSLVDSALCAVYAFNNLQNACIIDIGYEKADVTAFVDFQVQDAGRQIAVPACGGDTFTDRLEELLSRKKWNKEMCEQLKKSAICEILPLGIPLPGTPDAEITKPTNGNPAAVASTGATASGPGHRETAGALGDAPLGPGPGTQVGDDSNGNSENEGVLDIAKIVGSGNTKDFIAQKEKEKSEKVAFKKGQKQDAAAQAQLQRQGKTLNRDRGTNSFIYSDYAFLDAMKNKNYSADDMARAHAAVDEGAKQTAGEKQAAAEQQAGDSMDVDQTQKSLSSLIHTKAPRREIEVGIERFQAATGGAIDRIADAVQRTISSVNEVAKRSELWDNLIVIGNGAKIRGKTPLSLPSSLHLQGTKTDELLYVGFREALLSTIHARYIISPSSATIFTSELPSNTSTPLGTGAQTPQPGLAPPLLGGPNGPSAGGNALLLAATHHSAALSAGLPSHLQPPGTPGHHSSHTHQANLHSSHGQTPTSAKFALPAEYFPEWKSTGLEEAQFLGAQVLCKVIFVTDAVAGSRCFMTRTDYNELGPGGIGDFAL